MESRTTSKIFLYLSGFAFVIIWAIIIIYQLLQIKTVARDKLNAQIIHYIAHELIWTQIPGNLLLNEAEKANYGQLKSRKIADTLSKDTFYATGLEQFRQEYLSNQATETELIEIVFYSDAELPENIVHHSIINAQTAVELYISGVEENIVKVYLLNPEQGILKHWVNLSKQEPKENTNMIGFSFSAEQYKAYLRNQFLRLFLLYILFLSVVIFSLYALSSYFRKFKKNSEKEKEELLLEIKSLNNQLDEKNQRYNEIQTAKEATEENEKLKMYFLANMSHEIRTPMNGIIGFAQMMQKSDIAESKRIFYSGIIYESGIKLLRMIDDLIDISKIETDQLTINQEEVDIQILLKEVYAIHKPEVDRKQLDFVLINSIPKQNSLITADEQKLKQIFNYLMQNAITYTKSGSITIGAELKEEKLLFSVVDTGIGIQEKKHAVIFEKFKHNTAPINKIYGGTGLGLAISKGILKKMGGDIFVESETDKGAKFIFHIPFVAAKELPKNLNLPLSIKRKSLKGTTILIAENNQANYFVLNEALELYGPTLLHAHNGMEAIDFVVKNNAIDIVLMDIQMPIMDGNEALREIKRIRTNLPVIVQSEKIDDSDIQKYLKTGFDAVLPKPVNPEDLLKTIHQYL